LRKKLSCAEGNSGVNRSRGVYLWLAMKTLLLCCCVLTLQSVAQTHRKSTAHPAVPAQIKLSDTFAKVSLRALLAMNTDAGSSPDIVTLLVNDASVEAQTPDELKVVEDLRTLVDIKALNIEVRHLAFARAEKQWIENNQVGDLDALYRADPTVPASFKQDKDCQAHTETALRSRVYSRLPVGCKLPSS
jgi:hypothetical protein